MPRRTATKIGVHFHQSPPREIDALKALRFPVATVLNGDAGFYIPLLDRPDVEWIFRIYDPDVMSHSPEWWADHCHSEILPWVIRQGGNPKRFILQGTNESNLGLEHGNSGEAWDDEAHDTVILDWDLRFARAIRGKNPPYRLGIEWRSPGHNDVDGFNYVRKHQELYALADVYGGHFYAEGLDQGGFDAADRIYFSDRVLTVRAQLDELGYPHLPLYVGECNRKDTSQGDVLAEFERYCQRIQDAVASVTWFIWSSGDPGFATFQLADVPNVGQRFQSIIDKFADGTIISPPPPDPPAPDQPPAGGGQVDTNLIAKYALTVRQSETVGVKLLEVLNGTLELVAVGPPDSTVKIFTPDGQNMSTGIGKASIIMGPSSAYFPPAPGPWVATCGDARVDGLGWLGFHNHDHVRVEFYIKAIVPPVQPTEKPMSNEFVFAFADYAAAHPEVGEPTSGMLYPSIPATPLEDAHHIAIQGTSAGLLVFTGIDVLFIPQDFAGELSPKP